MPNHVHYETTAAYVDVRQTATLLIEMRDTNCMPRVKSLVGSKGIKSSKMAFLTSIALCVRLGAILVSPSFVPTPIFQGKETPECPHPPVPDRRAVICCPRRSTLPRRRHLWKIPLRKLQNQRKRAATWCRLQRRRGRRCTTSPMTPGGGQRARGHRRDPRRCRRDHQRRRYLVRAVTDNHRATRRKEVPVSPGRWRRPGAPR